MTQTPKFTFQHKKSRLKKVEKDSILDPVKNIKEDIVVAGVGFVGEQIKIELLLGIWFDVPLTFDRYAFQLVADATVQGVMGIVKPRAYSDELAGLIAMSVYNHLLPEGRKDFLKRLSDEAGITTEYRSLQTEKQVLEDVKMQLKKLYH
jgi:hypothetical protein